MRSTTLGTWTTTYLLPGMLLLPLAACSGNDAADNPKKVVEPRTKLVRVTAAVKTRMSGSIELSGNILQSQKAMISPVVPGTIRKIHKQEGDSVKKGEKLVELISTDFGLAVQQAQAGLDAAKAGKQMAQTGLDSLKVQYERFLGLRNDNAVTQVEFEKIETAYKTTQAQVQTAAAQVRLAQVGLKTVRKKYADTVTRAPFDGIVTQRMMDEGEMVRAMPPSVVLVMMSIDPVKAEAQVAERDMEFVRVGAQVEVTADALPGKRFSAVVDAVVPFVDPVTRTAKVRVPIPNPEHTLTPGMAATIRIALVEREVLQVPREAITSPGDGGTAVVWVVDREQRVHAREVTIDKSRHGGDVIILSGLQVGEQVVVAGVTDLTDGQDVRLSDGEKTEPAASPASQKAAAKPAGKLGEGAEEGR